MTAAEQLAVVGRKHLQSILRMSGQVLYSAASTLRPGPSYLLGHNPGGDANNRALLTVGGSLDDLPANTINSYLDTRWSGRLSIGSSPLQQRVKWLLSELGVDPRDVAASNLIFPRSRDAATSQFERYAELCWPDHEWILDVVRPRIVIAYRNSHPSPYTFLARKYAPRALDEYPSGHGTGSAVVFWCRDAFVSWGFPTSVATRFPHTPM